MNRLSTSTVAVPQGNPGDQVCWHGLHTADVLEHWNTSAHKGLSSEEARLRQQQFGSNELAQATPVPKWRKFLNQFNDLVIWILIVASILAGLMDEWSDTAAILAIVLVNGTIGFLQEERAGQALDALKKLSSPQAKVYREGQLQTLPARDLVPGDFLVLEAGDHVPADMRLFESSSLKVQEAALTGESVPVDKEATICLPAETSLGDRRNMVFLGTVVAGGKANGVVIAIGMETQLGRIAGLLEQTQPEPTPLQRRLSELGKLLVAVCLVIVVVIFLMEVARGRELLEVLLISVSLAVAAVPEGLPAVVTMTLALGLQRMVRRNALVRKLPSVEALGSVTVICTDKTGTLTRNEMTVREILTTTARYYVTGTGYAPHGIFTKAGEAAEMTSESALTAVEPLNEPDLQVLLTIAARCNNAAIRPTGDAQDDWQVIGDPTDGAILVAARKAGISALDQSEAVLFEMPFDSERKRMSVVLRRPSEGTVIYVKGAPESVLAQCTSEWRQGRSVPLTELRRAEILQWNAELAGRALRVLAMACRENPMLTSGESAETGLSFVGLAGMIDPPRDEVKSSILRCRSAGIRPVMITGDHPGTALAIARELQLATDADRVVTGRELDDLSEEALAQEVERIAVYARVTAEHKLRVVRAWQQRGEIVAMTGDGVNDAPAVKAADIGIAMGITGTDVTREASDLVLTDDNFTSIISAVEEGRGIFDNIQKVVHYLLSCNAGEVLLMFVAALLGWPVPLQAIQILWINLVTDGLPALALGMEPPERDIMRRRPRASHESIITWRQGIGILVNGSLVAAVCLIAFWSVYQGREAQLPRARTVTFCVAAFTQLCLSLGCRSQRFTMPELGLFQNPHLLAAMAISGLLQLSVVTLPFAQPVFEAATTLGGEWLLIIGLSVTPVTLIEIYKLSRKSWQPDTQTLESLYN